MSQITYNIIPGDYNVKKPEVAYGEVKTEMFYSSTVGKEREVTIALPPNYTEEKQYPVVYLCHGLGQDNHQWEWEGKVDAVLGNLLAAGEAEEMIFVLANCRARMDDAGNPKDEFSHSNFQAFNNFYNEFTADLQPYIEKKYSVKTGRENTAIVGFSMGGRTALYLGLGMQDKFGYIGAFCPAPGEFSYTRNGLTEPGLFEREDFKVKDEYKGQTVVMITAGDDDVVVGEHPYSYHEQLDVNGTEHIWFTLPGGHDFNVVGKSFYHFVKAIF